MLARPPKADPLAPSARYEAAARRWGKLARRRAELLERVEGITLALSLASNQGDASRVPEHLKKLAAPYQQDARNEPRRLVKRLATTNQDLAALRNGKSGESFQAWQGAMREETNRIARLLQPAHRKAVADMVKAVELLSQAIHAERDVLAELRERAPLAESAYLPDLGHVLGTDTLSDINSPLWRWGRWVRQLKIL